MISVCRTLVCMDRPKLYITGTNRGRNWHYEINKWMKLEIPCKRKHVNVLYFQNFTYAVKHNIILTWYTWYTLLRDLNANCYRVTLSSTMRGLQVGLRGVTGITAVNGGFLVNLSRKIKEFRISLKCINTHVKG